ncbi:MAG: recombinase RecT [Candidatus Atribacteria bacterium]|nr:recombinase RecT [Candidatus Atribacteria bacterium]
MAERSELEAALPAVPAKSATDLRRIVESDKVISILTAMLPASITATDFARSIVVATQRNPGLLAVPPAAVVIAALDGAVHGLDVTGATGEAYLIPYGKTVQCVVGYQGYLKKIYNSGLVETVDCDVVYAADGFAYRKGDNPRLDHEPCVRGDRGEVIGAYAIAWVKGARHPLVAFLTADELQSVENRSKAKSGPWKTDRAEMQKKTAIRRLRKLLPQAAELAALAAMDEELDFDQREPSQRVALNTIKFTPDSVADADDLAIDAKVVGEPGDDVPPWDKGR